MSTYLSLLRTAFWMLPVQRFCTVLGFGVMAGVGGTLLAPLPLAGTLTGWGCFIALAPSVLLGGAFWRALSATRVVSLAPRGRLRLLLAVLGLVITILLPLLIFGALQILGSAMMGIGPVVIVLVRNLPSMVSALLTTVLAFAAAWLITCFVASRSPLAMLLALVAWVVGVYAVWRFSIEHPGIFILRNLLGQSWSIVLPLVSWTLFGAWYLRARRIRPPGWLLPGGQSVLGAVALADTATGGIGQRAALERMALGGASVSRLLVQWSAVFGMLLFLLMLMALQGDDEARAVAHIAFAALILSPAVVAAQSVAIVRRARALWLHSGYSRTGLFGFTARTLLKFALGMGLVFAAFLLLLWYTQPWHPAFTLLQALALTMIPALLIAVHALSRPDDRGFYWPVVIAVLWITYGQLFVSTPFAWSDARAASIGTGWPWTAIVAVAVLANHLLARSRWQAEDLPRAATSR